MDEYKGCYNCKHANVIGEEPCKSCKNSFVPSESEWHSRELLWEPCEAVDAVNHPSHYETGKFECIDVMVETQGAEAVQGFCICNAFKYLYRHKNKNGLEDIKKAIWYLEKFIELEGKNND